MSPVAALMQSAKRKGYASVNIQLTNRDDPDATSGPNPRRRKSKGRIAFGEGVTRPLGLKLFPALWRRKQRSVDGEPKKVALHKGRGTRRYAVLIHLPPLVLSLFLIVLNTRGWFWGQYWNSILTVGLQFAAKILELLILGSVAAMLFSVLRHYLLGPNGITLGVLAASFQINGVAVLWSPELFSAFSSAHLNLWQKMLLATSLIVATLLGVSVGPASATLSLPRVDIFPAGGGGGHMNASYNSFIEPRIDATKAPDQCVLFPLSEECPAYGWDVIGETILPLWKTTSNTSGLPQIIPEMTFVGGKDHMRSISFRYRGNSQFTGPYTVGTCPFAAFAGATAQIAQIWNEATVRSRRGAFYGGAINKFFSLGAHQPTVYVHCKATPASQDIWNHSLPFPVVDPYAPNFPTQQMMTPEMSDWLQSTLNENVDYPAMTWLQSMPDAMGNVSAGVLAYVPTPSPTIFTCSAMAKFLGGGTIITPQVGWRVVASGNLEYASQERDYNKSWMADRSPDNVFVNLAPSWLNLLNPAVNTTGTERNYSATVFSELCRMSGVWGVDLGSQDQTASALESALVLMMTNGMSRINQNVSVIGTLKGYNTTNKWIGQVLPPPRSAFGRGGSPYDYPGDIDPDYLGFRVDARVEGYGWWASPDDKGAFLAVLILSFYATMALLWLSYTVLWMPVYSNSWDSVSEILALALNSDVSRNDLQNTGAGIHSLKTFEQMVRIVDKGGKVEFTLNDPGGETIKVNELYG